MRVRPKAKHGLTIVAKAVGSKFQKGSGKISPTVFVMDKSMFEDWF